MPAIPLSPEDLESQAVLKTNYVELHFHKPEGLCFPPKAQATFLRKPCNPQLTSLIRTVSDTQAFANFVKKHQDLSLYWDRCEAERIDERDA